MTKKTERIHSSKFEIYNNRYIRKGCNKTQLRALVGLDIIYDWEYYEITNEQYLNENI